MAYQVIARKYRPQRFADVVGQDHVTTTLEHAIEQGRIAHAYLFCGPRGTGKTTVARIFAKCLNCTDGPRIDFSEEDPRCREIAEGRSLDVMEIDGASNRGIDEIRSLRDTVKYTPATSKFKVYIIDEVHMLTKEAFNALLKTLEEPPEHVKFMFATTEPEKVLATILSRCQRFDLRRIPASLIVEHLGSIAVQEQVEIDPQALFAVARGADGGMRDAESTLDQLISFCGNRIREEDVLSMFGLAAQGQVIELFRAVIAGDTAGCLQRLDELCRHGKDLGRLLSDLLHHARNLLLYLVNRDDVTLRELSETEREALADEAQSVRLPSVTRIMEVLADHERRLRDAGSRRIQFEIALLRAIEARHAISVDDLLEQLQQLKGTGPSAAPSPAPSTAPTPPPQVARKAQPAAPKPSAPPAAPPAKPPSKAKAAPPQVAAPTDLPGVWRALLGALATTNRFLLSYLNQAHPIGLERQVLTIGYDPSVAEQLDLVNTDRNRQAILARLKELGVEAGEVRFVLERSPSGAPPVEEPPPEIEAPPPPPPAPRQAKAPPSPAPPPNPDEFSQEKFKQDPKIRKALELFRGQIVEVHE